MLIFSVLSMQKEKGYHHPPLTAHRLMYVYKAFTFTKAKWPNNSPYAPMQKYVNMENFLRAFPVMFYICIALCSVEYAASLISCPPPSKTSDTLSFTISNT